MLELLTRQTDGADADEQFTMGTMCVAQYETVVRLQIG